jgi:hypothetical protein
MKLRHADSLGFWRAALAHVLAERMLRGKAAQYSGAKRAEGLAIADRMCETRALLIAERRRWGLL